ncbi:hypothetical protein [Marinicella meishanensis]|uniref:hypothetical protein n=1 Tax=Marinicella meishanensis TaxID=2873263 RepID=UPI001CBF5AD0|nr:hypothetical protein [Marinicella sp. NBU2979]
MDQAAILSDRGGACHPSAMVDAQSGSQKARNTPKKLDFSFAFIDKTLKIRGLFPGSLMLAQNQLKCHMNGTIWRTQTYAKC